MLSLLRPAGPATGDRARSSSTGCVMFLLVRSLRCVEHRKGVRQLCQLFGLVWIVGAIVAYPIINAQREREARQLVLRLGGRYNVDRNPTADLLPDWLARRCGGECLYAVRSINLSHCDVGDEELETLLQFKGLEQINLCDCPRVTSAGVAELRRLPRMKLVWVDGMSIEDASVCLTGEPIAAAGR